MRGVEEIALPTTCLTMRLSLFWGTHNQKLNEKLRPTHCVIASRLHCYATDEEVLKFESYPPRRGEYY